MTDLATTLNQRLALADRADEIEAENARLRAENDELRRALDDRPSYDPILPTAEVTKMTGRSGPALRAAERRGTFPRAFRPRGGERCIGWRKSDVEAWMEGK